MPRLDLSLLLRTNHVSGGPSWAPTNLYAGGKLGLYYNADAAAVSVGSPVDTLADSSGNGVTIGTPQADRRPTLAYDATLGANYIDFDGVDDRLDSEDSVDFSTADGFTLFALITPREASTRGRLYTWGNTRMELPRDANNILRQVVPGQNTNVPNSALPGGWLDQVSCLVVTHEWATDQMAFRVNGSALSVTRPSTPVGFGYIDDDFVLCGDSSQGNIDVYEFGIVEGVASAGDLANIEGYLMAKGGIT